jgi:hypothetical protein
LQVVLSAGNLNIINFNLSLQPEITILNRLYALAASNMNKNWVPKHLHSSAKTKGQLISKCPFGVIVWTKIPTKKFDKFCPRI